MKKIVVFTIILTAYISAFADDPGERDSLIVETIFVDDYGTAEIKIYATCDDSVVFYNMPLAWYPDSGTGIYPVSVSYYYPIIYWDLPYDTILYDEGYIRMLGWCNGGPPDPPLYTQNLRAHCWTVHFAIDSLASPQIVTIDTTYDPINGSLLFGLSGGVIQLIPEFVPGAIFYGITSDNSEIGANLPAEFSLLQNYPNPFNASTTIKFTLPQEADVKLAIYNILGQKVATLFDGRKPAGKHTIAWDTFDAPSGIYFAGLKSGVESKALKMLLLK